MKLPLWATPERRAYLQKLNLLLQSGECSYGEPDCPVIQRFSQAICNKLGQPDGLFWVLRAALLTPQILATIPQADLHHFPNWLAKDLIDYWKADDRETRSILWKLERRRLHALPRITKRGEFDSIRREQFFAERPVFRIVGIGVNAFTQRRIAKVEVPDLHATLWVDISGIPLKASKHKLRKFARYKQGAAPKDITEEIDSRCHQAVEQFRNS